MQTCNLTEPNTTKVGLYPCPNDCSMFVQCGNGMKYEKDVRNHNHCHANKIITSANVFCKKNVIPIPLIS